MKIDKYEMLHGAALAQLTTHEHFTSLNRASDRYGHYLVNDSSRLWTKYSTATGPTWQFTFAYDDVADIWYDAEDHPDAKVHVVLVCGNETICLLPLEDLWSVIDQDEIEASQAVVVSAPAGKSMRVKGPLGQLSHTIHHNAFPDGILDEAGTGRPRSKVGVDTDEKPTEETLSVRLREIAARHYRPRTRHLGLAEFKVLMAAASVLDAVERFDDYVGDGSKHGLTEAEQVADELQDGG